LFVKESSPTVSAIIPAYNAEEYVEDAVTSALRQTYPLQEVVCVEDGSMDRTLVLQLQLAGITGGIPGSSPVMAFLGLMLMMASPQRPAYHSSCMWDFFPEQPLHQALHFGHS
jgi:cellulose synthase/poly-beta-1,6-N-acetylglucosamine synthase-like glycosyltransferase